MAWSDPKTWFAAEMVTAAKLNQYVRDNHQEMLPAKASAGVYFAADAAHSIVGESISTNDSAIMRVVSGVPLFSQMPANTVSGVHPVADPVTTKGDVLAASEADTLVRVPTVAGGVLAADSTVAAGVAFNAPPMSPTRR